MMEKPTMGKVMPSIANAINTHAKVATEKMLWYMLSRHPCLKFPNKPISQFVQAPITSSHGDDRCFHSVSSTIRKRPSDMQSRKMINIHSFLIRFHEYHESEIENDVPTILSVRIMYATKTTVRKIAMKFIPERDCVYILCP